MTPRFQELERVFAARRAALLDDPSGTVPEQVLVLETVGSIKDFINAVKRIDGLEWMAELEAEFEPDEDFFLEKEPEKSLGGRLYLVLFNQQALLSLLSLWKQYVTDPGIRFQYGQNKWKSLFENLRDIRPWDWTDRLRDTGIEDFWRERVEVGEERVRFEAELWYRQHREDRHRSEQILRQVIAELEGQVISSAVIPEIHYHGVLAELPIGKIQNILERVDLRLLQCEQVMFFRPMGQAEILVSGVEPLLEEAVPSQEASFLQGETPVVALLDGLPLENHPCLAGRLIVDDPDGWSREYQARERKHGTAMASLIIHGDLENREPPLTRPIYVRPVMKPNPLDFNDPRAEEMPWDCLPVDLLHRAVKRIFEGEGGEKPQAGNIKIINFSIGDKNRPFDRVMSPLARLIDWLAWHYNVLVLVSGGNQRDDLVLDASREQVVSMAPEVLEEKVLQAVVKYARQRRLLSPAEAINALTVGATHEDTCNNFYTGYSLNPCVTKGMPSPLNPVGLGYRRTIKPEILMPGGKQLYQERYTGSGTETKMGIVVSPGRPPGQKVAWPGPNRGISQSVAFTCGTSNATALATRTAAQLYEYIVRELRSEPGGEQLKDQHIGVLLKALLVHGAEWGEAYRRFEHLFRTPRNAQTFKEFAARFFGYGRVNTERLFGCTEQRATLIGCGQLGDGQAHIYRVPLPPSLSGRRDNRRLIITLAWFTPINIGHQAYRRAALWFEPPLGPLGVQRQDAHWQAVRRGTVQHEVLEGEKAVAYTDGSFMEIKVNCRADAGQLSNQVPYGLAVTLAVKEGVNLPIYQEIRERIALLVPVLPT
ncbi:hypothetical protein J2Z49_001335 [Desulfofundulus luciae]|uniref:Peptidase S8/S53 domain-containing protein n=1 Tax=Desulfofundulus luciae TaxID=74702 RepID=A0ABU0B468_9FIRM|nr:S8 family peptidase [Desulfofundulus luciae]MDQ0286223.1 hypothetical protein [Desulfofundulus luciae]